MDACCKFLPSSTKFLHFLSENIAFIPCIRMASRSDMFLTVIMPIRGHVDGFYHWVFAQIYKISLVFLLYSLLDLT